MIDPKDLIKALQFAAAAAAVNDARFYLQGVRIEATNQTWTLVGTDGRRMHVIEVHDNDAPSDGAVTVPLDQIKPLLALLKASKDAFISISIDGSTLIVGDLMKITGIDGVYPDWRRIVPDLTKPPGQFSLLLHPKYLEQAAKALGGIADGKHPGIMVTGGAGKMDVAVLQLVESFRPTYAHRALALIMPMRP